MNRNTTLTSIIAMLLVATFLIFVVSPAAPRTAPSSSTKTASNPAHAWDVKQVEVHRLCGQGRFDVCDWRVRERRSNY